jgi:hypothetical protein
MSPLIEQAVEFLAERAKAREAKTALAHRVYLRAILLGESPPGGAQTLADAVEHLDLSRYDLSNDDHAFTKRQDCLNKIAALDNKTRELMAAAREEDPHWKPGTARWVNPTSAPCVRAAEDHLETFHSETEKLENQAQQAYLKAPHVFGPDARKFMDWQPPSIRPNEPLPEDAPIDPDPDPDPDLVDDCDPPDAFAEHSPDPQPEPPATQSDSSTPEPSPQIVQSQQTSARPQYAW